MKKLASGWICKNCDTLNSNWSTLDYKCIKCWKYKNENSRFKEKTHKSPFVVYEKREKISKRTQKTNTTHGSRS